MGSTGKASEISNGPTERQEERLSRLKRFGRFWRRRPRLVYFLILTVLVAASIAVMATAYDGLTTLPWGLVALTVSAFVFSIFYSSQSLGSAPLAVFATAFAVLTIVVSFGFQVPSSTYAAVQDGGEVSLVAGEEFFWILPYQVQVSHISSRNHTITTGIELAGGGRVLWDIRADLTVTEDYSQAFGILTRVGSGPAWRQAVRQAFEQGVQEYLATNPQVQDLPREFEFGLPEQYRQRLAELGYSVSQVKASNIRFVPSED